MTQSLITNKICITEKYGDFLYTYCELKANLKNTRCPWHLKRNYPCRFIHDKTGDLSKVIPVLARIHTKNEIWQTKNYKIWCCDFASRKYWILRMDKRFKLGEGDFIEVNNEKLYCAGPIAHIYMSQSLISYCNDMTFEQGLLTIRMIF